MTKQFRASDEDWKAIEAHTSAHNYNCIRELRDRVLCMDACIRDIYDTLDTLNKRCDRNYIKASEIGARVEKLEQPANNPEQLPIAVSRFITRVCSTWQAFWHVVREAKTPLHDVSFHAFWRYSDQLPKPLYRLAVALSRRPKQ